MCRHHQRVIVMYSQWMIVNVYLKEKWCTRKEVVKSILCLMYIFSILQDFKTFGSREQRTYMFSA